MRYPSTSFFTLPTMVSGSVAGTAYAIVTTSKDPVPLREITEPL